MTDRKKINTVIICAIMWVVVMLLAAVSFYASLRLFYKPSEVFDADDIMGKTKQEIIQQYGSPDAEYENGISYLEDTGRFLRYYHGHQYHFVIEFDESGKAYRIYERYMEMSGS